MLFNSYEYTLITLMRSLFIYNISLNPNYIFTSFKTPRFK